MQLTRTSSRGQMVIPKSIRQALGIGTGTELGIELLPGGAFMVSVAPTDQSAMVRRLAGTLSHRGRHQTARQEEAALLDVVRADDERTRTRRGRRP